MCGSERKSRLLQESKHLKLIVFGSCVGYRVTSVFLFAVDINVIFLKLAFGHIDVSLSALVNGLVLVKLI
jgi:hypothetical protein